MFVPETKQDPNCPRRPTSFLPLQSSSDGSEQEGDVAWEGKLPPKAPFEPMENAFRIIPSK